MLNNFKGYLVSNQVYMRLRSRFRDIVRRVSELFRYTAKLAYSTLVVYTCYLVLSKLIGG